jgi:hypothetical protein
MRCFYDDTSLIGSIDPIPGRPAVIYRPIRRIYGDKKQISWQVSKTHYQH